MCLYVFHLKKLNFKPVGDSACTEEFLALGNFEPSRPFVQNGDVPKKNTLLPGKSTEGAVKALPVQTKNKNAVEILKHIVNARRFIKRKVSTQNLYTKQVNKLLEYDKSW